MGNLKKYRNIIKYVVVAYGNIVEIKYKAKIK